MLISTNNRNVTKQINKLLYFDTDKLKQRITEFQEKARPCGCDFNTMKRCQIQARRKIAEMRRTKKHAWWNDTCESVLKERLHAWEKYNLTKLETYKTQQVQTARAIQTEKHMKSLILKRLVPEEQNQRVLKNLQKESHGIAIIVVLLVKR